MAVARQAQDNEKEERPAVNNSIFRGRK